MISLKKYAHSAFQQLEHINNLIISSIQEVDDVPKANEMIKILVNTHENVARTARNLFLVLEKAHDQPTADIITQ